MLLNSSKLIAKWTARYSGICWYLGEFGGPVGGRQRRDDADDRLPFGDRQAGEGEPRDAADHDHQKDQGTANEQPRRNLAAPASAAVLFAADRTTWPWQIEVDTPNPHKCRHGQGETVLRGWQVWR